MNRPKPKRVVSKAEYRRYLAKKWLFNGIGYTVALVAIFSIVAMLIISAYVGVEAERKHYILSSVGILGVVGSLLLAFFVSFFLGAKVDRSIRELEPVEPVSRHNIDRLAPSEALVRASDAPQTPETVLLRAAQETETPQEQLLRAVE